ncbi:MAG: NAD(P)H-dependent oxidoreductase [Rhodospirillales bacterium]|nr:NAD(P)H-dependent oxidoreductase [Rhodospirillales bacterium]
MNVLIVHAHPERRSFTAAMKDCAVETFSAAGHSVVVSDLYAMGFEPVASAADFAEPANPDYLVYALEQRHAYESGNLARDIALEIDKLIACDLLLFNFPLFWFSVPAILKGWIDRVLISGLTYGGKRFYDRGGLAGKKGTIAMSLGGRAHMFGRDAIHGELETMLRPLLRGTLYYVGLEVLPPFYAYHVPYISDAARREILVSYREHLLALDRLPPLRFPRLDDFDDKLFPKPRG